MMNALRIPLNLSDGDFYDNNKVEERNIEKAVTAFIQLLIDSENGSFRPDFNFGFSLKNCQFENIYMQGKNHQIINIEINKRKNSDYARILKETILKYEPRLRNTLQVETLTREENENRRGKNVMATKVIINIKGILINGEEYNKDFKLNIWS
jgi:hypothetical protein